MNGLLTVLESTSPVYWTLSVLAGLVLLVWACVRRFPGVRPVLAAVATTALVAGAICGVFATANHYVLDAVAGGALGLAGLRVARLFD